MKVVLNDKDLNMAMSKDFSKIIDKADSVDISLNLNVAAKSMNLIKNMVYNGTSVQANIKVSKPNYKRLKYALNLLIGIGVSQIQIIPQENALFPKIIDVVNKTIRDKSAWWADISVSRKQESRPLDKHKQLEMKYKRKYSELLMEEQRLIEEMKKIKEAKVLMNRFLKLKEKLHRNIKDGEPFHELEQQINKIFAELRKNKKVKPLINKFVNIQNQKKDCLKKYNKIIKKLAVQQQRKVIKTVSPKRIKEPKLESYTDDSLGIAKPWKPKK